jgi:hypothetical protein
MFTLFSRNALASALDPTAPILFDSRLSVVSVCERKLNTWRIDINEKKMFTSFSRKALASALAPLSLIPLLCRLSVVSVYQRKVNLLTRDRWRKRCSLCFLGKH